MPGLRRTSNTHNSIQSIDIVTILVTNCRRRTDLPWNLGLWQRATHFPLLAGNTSRVWQTLHWISDLGGPCECLVFQAIKLHFCWWSRVHLPGRVCWAPLCWGNHRPDRGDCYEICIALALLSPECACTLAIVPPISWFFDANPWYNPLQSK